MSGKKGMKHYPLASKLEAVRLHQEEGKTFKEIVKILDLQNAGRAKKWWSDYRQRGEAAFQQSRQQQRAGRPPKRANTEAYIARLEMENDLLKKFHAELRKLELAKRNIGSSTITEEHTK